MWDESFEYARNLARDKGNLQVVGTSYTPGLNTQDVFYQSDNLTLVRNVDATQLSTGALTGARRWDAIIFNNPHTGTPFDYTGTSALISGYRRSAGQVVASNGAVHINATEALLRADLTASQPGQIAAALGDSGDVAGLSVLPRFKESYYYAPFIQRYATGNPFRSQDVGRLLNFTYAGGTP